MVKFEPAVMFLNLRFFTGTAVFFLADLSPTANFLWCLMSVRNSCVLFPHPTVSHLLLTGWLVDNLLQKRAKLSLPVKKSRTLSHRYHHWKINKLYIKLPKFLFNKKSFEKAQFSQHFKLLAQSILTKVDIITFSFKFYCLCKKGFWTVSTTWYLWRM